jgi:hypothetical protein
MGDTPVASPKTAILPSACFCLMIAAMRLATSRLASLSLSYIFTGTFRTGFLLIN